MKQDANKLWFIVIASGTIFILLIAVIIHLAKTNIAISDKYKLIEQEKQNWILVADSFARGSDSLKNVILAEQKKSSQDERNTHDAQNRFNEMPFDSNVVYFLQWTNQSAIK